MRQDGYWSHAHSQSYAFTQLQQKKIPRLIDATVIIIIIHLERSVCFIVIILVMRR